MALLQGREAVMRHFRPLLSDHDITEQQWRVLRALAAADQPLTVGDVAEQTFLLGPSLSRIAATLQQRSLIERTTSATDQRRSNLSLTPNGRNLVNQVAPHSESVYRQIETSFGPMRLNQLLGELHDLTAALSPSNSGPSPPTS